MPAGALEAEGDARVAALAHEVDERGHRLVVGNGHARPRVIATGAGPIEVEDPRINGQTGGRGNRRAVPVPQPDPGPPTALATAPTLPRRCIVPPMTTGKAAALMVLLALALAACGSDPPKGSATSGGATTAPSGAGSARSVTGTATTANGHYRITLAVGAGTPGGAATVCAPGAAPGGSSLSVGVTVVNTDNRAAPFPPLRVELDAGGSPAPVPVRDSSGTCSFTPHDGALQAGASVTLPGSTPAIDDNAAPGSAGRLEVAISENDFTLAVPVP